MQRLYTLGVVCVKNTTRNIQSRKQSENVDRVFNVMVIPGANCLIPFLLLLVCVTQSINKIP